MQEEFFQQIRTHYRSGHADLSKEFFLPCLMQCERYDRAAAFFSSSALVTWAAILPKLTEPTAIRLRLLIAPVLSPDDRGALGRVSDGEGRREFLQSLADGIALDVLQFLTDPDDKAVRIKLFCWLVATEKLQLRFAFPTHVLNPGIFHEKIGVFYFPGGRTVAFTGSANESEFGHSLNYETVDVFRSWVAEDRDRVETKILQFEDAWEGRAAGLSVIRLSADALRRIRERAPKSFPLDSRTDGEPQVAEEPVHDARWVHQDEALRAFLEKEHGIIEMATGTGKTHVALRICGALVQQGQVTTIIVSADGNDLLDQWYKQLLSLSGRLATRMPILRHYGGHHQVDRFVLNPSLAILLVSRRSLRAGLSGLTDLQRSRSLLIHDEVHRLGSVGNRHDLDGLADGIRFRLGLSATPEREYDVDGNRFVERHIGPVIFRYDLADAIRRGTLAPFEYFPLLYTPSEDDQARLRSVYKRASARRQEGNPMSQEELWIELARVYKTSKAKLDPFSRFLQTRTELLRRCIVFVETKEYGDDVLDIIHRYRHDFHTYYAEDDSDNLRRFASGQLECLITCHRLSEGIDIQSLSSVVLFSSARSRLETIQRMGRCLRVDSANPSKRASVVDFIRTRPEGEHISESAPVEDEANPDMERMRWLQELSRVR